MSIPPNDIPRWQARFKEATPSEVLREIASFYTANKSTLGFMLAEIYETASTPEVQAVWTWDLERVNRGLSDAQLNEILHVLVLSA